MENTRAMGDNMEISGAMVTHVRYSQEPPVLYSQEASDSYSGVPCSPSRIAGECARHVLSDTCSGESSSLDNGEACNDDFDDKASLCSWKTDQGEEDWIGLLERQFSCPPFERQFSCPPFERQFSCPSKMMMYLPVAGNGTMCAGRHDGTKNDMFVQPKDCGSTQGYWCAPPPVPMPPAENQMWVYVMPGDGVNTGGLRQMPSPDKPRQPQGWEAQARDAASPKESGQLQEWQNQYWNGIVDKRSNRQLSQEWERRDWHGSMKLDSKRLQDWQCPRTAANWTVEAQSTSEPPSPTKEKGGASNKKSSTKSNKKSSRSVKQELTTIILRNIPLEITRDMLLQILDEEGFSGGYDFVHLPIDFHTRVSLGYALVNLVSQAEALRAQQHFEGFKRWPVACNSLCEVAWNNSHQGIALHIDRYRNSPLMHETVPEEYRPALFKNGVRIAFPPPTVRRIRAPRIRHQKLIANGNACLIGTPLVEAC